MRDPRVPRHPWLGCAAWVCVLGLGLRLRPATPGWGVGVCVCWCARSACTCHSWLGFAVWRCVLGLGFWLHPATPGWGVGVCVCWCSRSACTPQLLAGVCGVGVCAWARVSAAPHHSWLGCWDVCVLVFALRLYPATPGPGVRRGCVCSGSGFGCAPPLLAGVFGCVCAGVRAPPVPRHSWLACWCVCSGSGYGSAPPLLAGVSGLWVGCCLAPVPVPWFVLCCARCPGLRHRVAVVAWHLFSCRGCGRRRVCLACLVAPPWCAAPRPVRSLSVLRSAFPSPWCLSPPRGVAPPALPGGCAGHGEAGREPGSLCLPLAPAKAGALGSLRVVPVRGPATGLSLAGPSGVGLGLRALRCFACVDPVTDASGFPYRPSFDGGLGRCTGAVWCGHRDRPFRVGGRHAHVLCVCACACFVGRVRRAGLPGAFWCASPFPVAGLAALFVCWAPSGLGLPFFLFVRPGCLRRSLFFGPGLPALGVSPLPPFFFPFCAPVVSGVLCFPPRGALGLGVFLSPPPPLLFFFPAFPRSVFFPSPLAIFFVFFFFVRPRCLLRSVFSGLGFLGPWRLVVAPAPPPLLFFPSCLLFAFFFRLCLAGGAVRGWCVCRGLWVVLVPASVVLSLSLLFVWCSLASLVLVGIVWCCPSCLGVCCFAWLSSVASWWVLVSCSGGAVPVWRRGSPPCGLVWCVLVLRCPVLCSVALCCRVVVFCRSLLFVCVVACACCLFPAAGRLLCVFCGPVLCVPSPLRPVRCCAALCWCPCVVLSALSALFLVLGAVGSWCRCVFLGVCWWLWLPGVVVWWCVSALVSVSGRVSRRSASSLWCPVPLCCVLWRCAAVWCCSLVPCRLFLLFFFCALLVALVVCFR